MNKPEARRYAHKLAAGVLRGVMEGGMELPLTEGEETKVLAELAAIADALDAKGNVAAKKRAEPAGSSFFATWDKVIRG